MSHISLSRMSPGHRAAAGLVATVAGIALLWIGPGAPGAGEAGACPTSSGHTGQVLPDQVERPGGSRQLAAAPSVESTRRW